MSLLHMSFAGAVMILAVTVIRALVIYRVPKKTFNIFLFLCKHNSLNTYSYLQNRLFYKKWEQNNTAPII